MSYKALQNQKVFTGLPTAKAENTLYEKWGGAKVCLLCLALLMVLTGHAYACAMTAVIGNGTTMLTDQMAWLDEASWLQGTSHTNNDGWGACYYHASGYAQHHYQLLPVDDNSFPSRSDHYYRTDTNIGAPQSPTVGGYSNWAQSEQGKILLAHARNASSGEPSGAFAPFIYHSEAENIDYSFAHHGEVPKHSMINDIPGFADFLISYDYENNTNYFSSPNSNVDSAYLFLWIMQNIGENDGDVKLGIAAALNEIAYDRRYQINILLSDGDGVYAYTNNRDSGHRMGYVNDTSDNELSYLVRSWKAPVLSWAEGSFTSIDTHHLYYFPTQGQMEITHNVDKSIPASFALKPGLNWIGYFDTESVWPTDAFASIWNDITMIKAKDWCLYRDPNSGIGALIGKMLPINCGDMVIVTTVNDHEFQWNTTIPTDPKKKEVPTAFEYVEKADYTPVYIDLSAIDLSNLKETGLKLDGICKGAVVVTDSLEQICAYLDEGESLSSGLVELVFFYESKSQPLEMRSVAINDKQLNSSIIGGDSAYPVYNIKVSTADLSNTVVPVLSLEQNYPNPFNPTTSIRYSIEETGPVSLDIYNIKGQLVKTLYHGNAEIGSHTAIWNGLDNSGNACSSGVYFYRLKTPKTSLVRKMLMLK